MRTLARSLAQTWAECPGVQVSPNGIGPFRPHHPKLLSLQEMMCGIRPNLSPCNTSGGGQGGVDDAGRGLDDLMHAFALPVRTRDQEVLNN